MKLIIFFILIINFNGLNAAEMWDISNLKPNNNEHTALVNTLLQSLNKLETTDNVNNTLSEISSNIGNLDNTERIQAQGNFYRSAIGQVKSNKMTLDVLKTNYLNELKNKCNEFESETKKLLEELNQDASKKKLASVDLDNSFNDKAKIDPNLQQFIETTDYNLEIVGKKNDHLNIKIEYQGNHLTKTKIKQLFENIDTFINNKDKSATCIEQLVTTINSIGIQSINNYHAIATKETLEILKNNKINTDKKDKKTQEWITNILIPLKTQCQHWLNEDKLDSSTDTESEYQSCEDDNDKDSASNQNDCLAPESKKLSVIENWFNDNQPLTPESLPMAKEYLNSLNNVIVTLSKNLQDSRLQRIQNEIKKMLKEISDSADSNNTTINDLNNTLITLKNVCQTLAINNLDDQNVNNISFAGEIKKSTVVNMPRQKPRIIDLSPIKTSKKLTLSEAIAQKEKNILMNVEKLQNLMNVEKLQKMKGESMPIDFRKKQNISILRELQKDLNTLNESIPINEKNVSEINAAKKNIISIMKQINNILPQENAETVFEGFLTEEFYESLNTIFINNNILTPLKQFCTNNDTTEAHGPKKPAKNPKPTNRTWFTPTVILGIALFSIPFYLFLKNYLFAKNPA